MSDELGTPRGTDPPPPTTRIESFARAHIGQAVQIFCAVFSAAPWFEPWRRQDARELIVALLDLPDARNWAVREGAAVIGFALGWREDDVLVLQEMAVRADRQNRGVGTRLMRTIEDAARAEGVAEVHVITSPDMWPCHWYERMGYRRIRDIAGVSVVLARAVR